MQITKGILSTFFAKTAVSLLGLAVVIITSRNLGAEGRGIISLMMSLIAFVQLFCDFGSNSALINLSYNLSQRRLWLSSLAWVLMICCFSYIPAFFFGHIAFVFLVPPAAFLYSFINTNNLLLMGNRRVHQRNIMIIALPLFLLLGLSAFFRYADAEPEAYPAALFSALLICSVLSFLLLRDKLKPAGEAFVFETQVLKQGVWVQGGHAVQFLNYRINFFIVAFMIGEAALGVYNNAVIVAESVWILGHSMGQMQHMKILNTDDINIHTALTSRLMKINFLATAFGLLVLVCVPARFWAWVFSPDFAAMSSLFPYLAAGVLCFSISNIINHFLHAKNRFGDILKCNMAGLVSGVAVSIALIPEFGLEGACISWSCGLLVSMVAYIIIYKRYLKSI